jgi:hypothetical protein
MLDERVVAEVLAVIARHDDEGLIEDAARAQVFDQLAHDGVEIGDLAVIEVREHRALRRIEVEGGGFRLSPRSSRQLASARRLGSRKRFRYGSTGS